MAKKRRDQHRRPQKRRPTRGHLHAVPAHDPAKDQPLIRGIRAALRQETPLALLQTVSGIMHATDPRSRGPFAPSDDEPITLDDVVESFTEIDLRETTAALAVIAALSPDPEVRQRCRQALLGRRQPLPDWIRRLDEVTVPRVMEMTHVLGDGDDYFLDVRIPGHATTVVVYVDHNLNGVVKDAFPAEGPLEDVLSFSRAHAEEDTEFREIDPADARARMQQAVEHGALMFPPPESDTWPQVRPLVEWLLRCLPGGGTPYRWPELSEADERRITEDFFGSPWGAPLDDADHRELFGHLLWFGQSNGTGDPLRWSPVNVEILLADWFPRKVPGEPVWLAKLPDLLRAFIEYSHHQRRVRRKWTVETLQSVDRWSPDYQRQIRTTRPQGAEALAQMLVESQKPDDDWQLLADLERAVGGRTALANLATDPLPDEPFEWAGIPEDVRDPVREVLEMCDQHAEQMLDVEHRTAERRLLSRVAVSDPGLFRGRGAARTSAAAVVWLVARANETTSIHGPLTMQQLLEPLGVRSASSDRARAFLRALGLEDQEPGQVALGSVDLLVSARRERIVREKDLWLNR